MQAQAEGAKGWVSVQPQAVRQGVWRWVIGILCGSVRVWVGPQGQDIACNAPPAWSKDSFTSCKPTSRTRRLNRDRNRPQRNSGDRSGGGVFTALLSLIPPAGSPPIPSGIRSGVRSVRLRQHSDSVTFVANQVYP